MSWPAVWSQASTLSPHCEPANDFLLSISRTFHTCIPTPLALASSTLGVISILCWLFAQLPQIYKNWRIGSTSGLSIFFLVEWCLGDFSNLFGAILTNQASWQVCIGAYYVFVDLCLVCQWIWYERLQHGNIVRRVLRRRSDGGPSKRPDEALLIEGVDVSIEGPPQSENGQKHLKVADQKKPSPSLFRSFDFSNNDSIREKSTGASSTTIVRTGEPDSSFLSLSPRTVLLVVALSAIAQASPLYTQPNNPNQYQQSGIQSQQQIQSIEVLGTALSWTSTILYLLSRLPQLLQNFRRKSTAGLSPLLFAAAFSGNLFYSAALLTNPCAWNDFDSFGGRGWAGREGSVRAEWVAAALPFFLGAAGVLGLDAAVGVQFVVYGSNGEKVIVEDEDGSSSYASPGTSVTGEGDEAITGNDVRRRRAEGRKQKWRRVSGWMRGWIPSASLQGTGPSKLDRTQGEAGESEALLQVPRSDSRTEYRAI